MFLECGWTAWLVLLLTLISLTLGIVSLVLSLTQAQAARLVAALAIAAALLPAGMGAIGTWHGRSAVEAAVAGIDPSQRAQITQMGYAEAAQCTKLGMGGSVLPLVLGVAAVLVAVMGRREEA